MTHPTIQFIIGVLVGIGLSACVWCIRWLEGGRR
jgi:hypothetical protein